MLSLVLSLFAQVFTSTSTVIFQTFACDDVVIHGESRLRADYRLPCDTETHLWFEVYAGVMLVVRVSVLSWRASPPVSGTWSTAL